MNEFIRNMIVQLIIPIALIIYYMEYKKASVDTKIPDKKGFRTKYSLKNIENWNKTNRLAAKITKIIIIIDFVACIISLILQIMKYTSSTKLYVITVAFMLFTHFASVMYIQFKNK